MLLFCHFTFRIILFKRCQCFSSLLFSSLLFSSLLFSSLLFSSLLFSSLCPTPSPRQIVLLDDPPTLVEGVSRLFYPGPFTPLRKPPRCPVSATMSTATASIGKRYPGGISSWFRRDLLWMNHTTQIRTVDAHPITRCVKRIPFSF